MHIAGLAKTTLVDFPGIVAATVFTRGCTFRCHYCHNPELVLPDQFNPLIPEEEFFSFLETRYGKLGGVCITGGEPTINPDLPSFISHIKALGFKVKLDSNGTNSEMLEQIIKDGDTDYFAMDIKAPIDKYQLVTNSKMKNQNEKIRKSIRLIMNSNIPYEFRTTFAKPLLNVADAGGIGKMIKGADKYIIQNYLKTKQISEEMDLKSFSDKELKEMAKIISYYVDRIEIR